MHPDAQVKEVEAQARIKDLDVAELKKIKKDVARRLRDYEKLYDLVKNQRNKFVNLIQVGIIGMEEHRAPLCRKEHNKTALASPCFS